VAAFIGAMVTLRIYWKKVKVLLHLGSHDSDEERPH
jgi:hypothetical protein